MTAEQSAPRHGAAPHPGTPRITDEVVRQVGRLAYLWRGPWSNMHNRRAALEQVPTNGLIGGVMPAALLNNITTALVFSLLPPPNAIPSFDRR